jgi:phage shock protein A
VRNLYTDATKKIGKLENGPKAAEAAIQASDQDVRKLYAEATKKIDKLENDLKASDREVDQARAKIDHVVSRMIGMYRCSS